MCAPKMRSPRLQPGAEGNEARNDDPLYPLRVVSVKGQNSLPPLVRELLGAVQGLCRLRVHMSEQGLSCHRVTRRIDRQIQQLKAAEGRQ